jgi:hypothetical protein
VEYEAAEDALLWHLTTTMAYEEPGRYDSKPKIIADFGDESYVLG